MGLKDIFTLRDNLSCVLHKWDDFGTGWKKNWNIRRCPTQGRDSTDKTQYNCPHNMCGETN